MIALVASSIWAHATFPGYADLSTFLSASSGLHSYYGRPLSIEPVVYTIALGSESQSGGSLLRLQVSGASFVIPAGTEYVQPSSYCVSLVTASAEYTGFCYNEVVYQAGADTNISFYALVIRTGLHILFQSNYLEDQRNTTLLGGGCYSHAQGRLYITLNSTAVLDFGLPGEVCVRFYALASELSPA